MKRYMIRAVLISAAILTLLTFTSCKKQNKKVVKVGLLHSLTGTMSISEVGVRDAELLAINEINEAGGVLGCQIKVIEEDGKSNPRIFAEKAKKQKGRLSVQRRDSQPLCYIRGSLFHGPLIV